MWNINQYYVRRYCITSCHSELYHVVRILVAMTHVVCYGTGTIVVHKHTHTRIQIVIVFSVVQHETRCPN